MSSLHRAALSVGLTLVPMLGTGCTTLHLPRPLPLGGATTTQPSTSENKLNLARLEESRGNFANARKIYSELHQKEPSNAVSVHRLAVICLHLNQQEEADFYFQKAYALDSTNAELLADMGFAAFQKKDYAKSEEYLEQAARLDGTNSRTIENLAIALAWRGNDDASLTAFRQVHDEAEAVRRLNAIQAARTTTQMNADQQIVKARPSLRARIPDPTGAPPIKDFTMPPAPHEKEIEVEMPAATIPVIAETLPTIPATVVTESSRPLEAKVELPPSLPETKIEAPSVAWVDAKPVQPAEPVAVASQPVAPQAATPQETARIPEVIRIPQESFANIPVELATKATPTQYTVIQVIQSDSPRQASESAHGHESTKVVVVVTPQANFQRGSEDWAPDAGTTFVAPNAADTRFVSNSTAGSNVIAASSKAASPWRKTSMARRIASEDQPIRLETPSIRQTSSSSIAQDDCSHDWRVCLVTLIEENKVVPGKPVYSMEMDSRNYMFSSAEAYRKFRAAPKNYIPAKEGMDVVALRKDRNAVPGSLNFAVYHQHRLYLFASQENAEEFTRHPNHYAVTE